MTIYTKEQYDKMMKPMRDEIKASRKPGWKPVDIDSDEVQRFCVSG